MSYVWVYLHRSYIVMDPIKCGACLRSFASQNFVLSRDTTCASKTHKPCFMPWVSTISTYGLNKILQVSCHRCKKQYKLLLNMYDLLLQVKKSFVWTCDGKEIKVTTCLIKVSITRGNIKWCSFTLRVCTSENKKRMTTSASLYRGLSFTFVY